MVRRLFSFGDPICDCCSSLSVLWICLTNGPFLFLSDFLIHLPPEHFWWFVQFVIYDPHGRDLIFVTYMYFYIEKRGNTRWRERFSHALFLAQETGNLVSRVSRPKF